MLKRFKLRALALAALLVFGGSSFVLGQMSTSGRVRLNKVGDVFVQVVGPGGLSTTAPTGTDSRTTPVKTAGVFKLTLTTPNDVSSGAAVAREVDLLYRVQETSSGVFIDFVYDATITSLSTTVLNMNLITGPASNPAGPIFAIGHPSPSKDVIDAQALVSAGGS